MRLFRKDILTLMQLKPTELKKDPLFRVAPLLPDVEKGFTYQSLAHSPSSAMKSFELSRFPMGKYNPLHGDETKINNRGFSSMWIPSYAYSDTYFRYSTELDLTFRARAWRLINNFVSKCKSLFN